MVPPVNPVRQPGTSTRYVNPAPRCAKRGPPVGSGASDRARRIGRVGSGDFWDHAPICDAKAECQSPNMVPPVSSSPTGSAGKLETVPVEPTGATPKTVPPVSSDRCQPGATPSSEADLRCHPPIHARPFGVPAPIWCHPPVRSATKEPPLDLPERGHPPVRLRQIRPGSSIQGIWGHPPIRSGRNRGHPSVPLRLPKQCHLSVRVGSEPKQCHPSVRRAAKLVPPPDASLGPPPNPGGGSGVVAAGLSAQPCSRSPALVASGASPTAADCA